MGSLPFPAAAISDALRWGQFLGDEWRREFPTAIHGSTLAEDGTPGWSADFAKWLSNAPDDEGRRRTTSAMRHLRRVSPRCYEVLYRAMVLGQSFEEVTSWLNERAVRNAIPLPEGRDVHYRSKDTVAIFLAGVSAARSLW